MAFEELFFEFEELIFAAFWNFRKSKSAKILLTEVGKQWRECDDREEKSVRSQWALFFFIVIYLRSLAIVALITSLCGYFTGHLEKNRTDTTPTENLE